MWKVIAVILFVNVGIVRVRAAAAPIDDVTKPDFLTINEFALQLMDNTYTFQENFPQENFALSPLSVWSIFALLTEGSSGETYAELSKTLKLPADLKNTQTLHLAVSDILATNNKYVIFKGKQFMFSDCTLEVNPEFCKAATVYNTDIHSVDASNTTKLAKKINYHVCTETDGRITNAVEPDMLEDLKLIIVDALYFKAEWNQYFDHAQTTEDTFYNSQGKDIGIVNMMYHEGKHKVLDIQQIEAQVLELTYGQNEEFSMLILLPFDGVSIKKLLNNLATSPLNWITKVNSVNPTMVDCFIPRFTISCPVDLTTPLKYSGINSIFDIAKANLPGVSDTPLYVSRAVQKVEIEVTEEGTTASSTTIVGFENRFGGQVFKANKEFVFLILKKNPDVILFSGVYNSPMLV